MSQMTNISTNVWTDKSPSGNCTLDSLTSAWGLTKLHSQEAFGWTWGGSLGSLIHYTQGQTPSNLSLNKTAFLAPSRG